uniref:KIB1-4 beta-propeller domain-containing protein n=1 Tax=Davidia involucrata TaxID=16924 RepID=A0A5B7BBG8_DAVIN
MLFIVTIGFYAIDVLGRVLMCDVSSAVVVTKFVSPELPECNCRLHDKYLVESAAGNLLQVLRFLCRRRECINQYETKEIKVFKLDCQNWIELESLGDDALFVGGNDSLSVLASDFPRCQPGCIYYTHGFSHSHSLYHSDPCGPFGPLDMGVFNLEDKCFQVPTTLL